MAAPTSCQPFLTHRVEHPLRRPTTRPDEQWSVLESLLPAAGVGRKSGNRRRLVDGVRWRVRTGVPWRDLPREYGPWQTVYGLFRRWQRAGIWARLLTMLQGRADAVISGSERRLHGLPGPSARGWCPPGRAGQKEPPGGLGVEPEDHGLGRSRGGRVHAWTCQNDG
ncbi:transposase [Streptomyces sp. APSN-46.1]|nr:transposase [Streptomyces sp. APSN-46.1]